MRTKRQKQEHQGGLSGVEKSLLRQMREEKGTFFTSRHICLITGCVSARDKVRKLKANGAKISEAALLRTSENGTRVYGWRIEK